MIAYKFLPVTEASAIAAYQWIGKGQEKLADRAAVDVMRKVLNSIEFSGTIVVGEGERDEAPMLFIGEKVGLQVGALVDIAVDPLEGTALCAEGSLNAISVLAIADRGGILHVPDIYMNKIVVGTNLPANIIDLDLPIEDNIANLAAAKGSDVAELRIAVLKRERHAGLIAAIRKVGARVILLEDGDVVAAIATCLDHISIDMYIGIGGAPEGILAAAAIKVLGGQMKCRFHFTSESQKDRIVQMGIRDISRQYNHDEMVPGDNVCFIATGVTDGMLLDGVHYNHKKQITTHSIIISKQSHDKIITTIRRQHI